MLKLQLINTWISFPKTKNSWKDDTKVQNMAIAFAYKHKLGAPPPEEWGGKTGTVAVIRRMFNTPGKKCRMVYRVLHEVYCRIQNKVEGGVVGGVQLLKRVRLKSRSLRSGWRVDWGSGTYFRWSINDGLIKD